MVDEEDADAGGSDATQFGTEVAALVGVEAGRGLVEEDEKLDTL